MFRLFKYILLIVLIILLVSVWEFNSFIHPDKIRSDITPKTLNIDYEAIQFETKDHVLIKGWFIPNKNPAAKTIILLHGYPADKGDILPSRVFLRNDYNLLFIDFRYLGESEGNYSTLGKEEVLDVLGAIDYLHKRGVHDIGIWGLSMGAVVALNSASQSSDIKAIVAEAPFASLDLMIEDHYPIPAYMLVMKNLLHFWAKILLNVDIKSINAGESLKNISIPVLLIFYKQDQVVQNRQALIMQAIARDKTNVDVIVIDDAAHGQITAEYQAKVLEFFNRFLGS